MSRDVKDFWEKREETLLSSAIEAIGSTPLVELKRFTSGLEGRILGKCEMLNPGYSKKDRIARQIIEDAEKEGLLQPGQCVVELTSGNTGTGLAIVCGIKGYPFIAVMSKGNSIERARMMEALGAEVVLVDQLPDSQPGQVSGGDLELVEECVEDIVKKRKAFRADQFRNQGNFRAHYLQTAREIIDQTGGKFDAFCDFMGSGGTFSGCAAAFKEYKSNIQCYAVEPEGGAIKAGQEITRENHRIQGGGYVRDELCGFDETLVDGYLQISDEDAMFASRKLAREEGLFAGFSTGANLAAATQLLQGELRGKTIVCTLNDSGLKYLSTDLWE